MSDLFFRIPSFGRPLQYEQLETRRRGLVEFRLTEPFSFEIGGWGSKTYIVVPVGFVTDLASIPKGIRWLLPPDGPYAKAAVVHDFMYEHATHFAWERLFCDMLFLEGMKTLGIAPVLRFTIYLAVRTFGGNSFKMCSKLPEGIVVVQSSSGTSGKQK